MAGLTWADVAIIGAVATVGFSLLVYWFSGVMARRNWTYQVKPKAMSKKDAKAKDGSGST